MKQFVMTPSMGKRLIGKALASHPKVRAVLRKGTLVIVAGTTNGYVAEEILESIGQREGFSRAGFFRGVVAPPDGPTVKGNGEFPGDVIIAAGRRQEHKTLFDVADDLRAGDLILKGANAVDVRRGHAAVYIGDPQGGTAGVAIRAVVGRRVELIVPVGLEKRVLGNVTDLATQLNAPQAEGPRLLPLPGQAFTELDAIALLTGAAARLVAGGGVHGAEGCVWIAVTGEPAQLQAAEKLIHSISSEPPCAV